MRNLLFAHIWTLCLMGLVISGCGSLSSFTGPENSGDSPPIIVHLQTRDRIVTVMAGPEGPLYTVRTRKGRVLAWQLREQELRARMPYIHHVLKTSYAEDDEAGVIWAGMMVHGRQE